ncbi:hypothetical protein OIO90_005103 [Microbotryomycetes sp. JL221]|nr:hypothetical protein OIO90_005103 [Microbotryomycetes sp. JL221]
MTSLEATADALDSKLRGQLRPDPVAVLALLHELEFRRLWAIEQLAQIPISALSTREQHHCMVVQKTLAHPEAIRRFSAIDLTWRKLTSDGALSSRAGGRAQQIIEMMWAHSTWPRFVQMSEDDQHLVLFRVMSTYYIRACADEVEAQTIQRPTENSFQHLRVLSVDWFTTIRKALASAEKLIDSIPDTPDEAAPLPPSARSSPGIRDQDVSPIDLSPQQDEFEPRTLRSSRRMLSAASVSANETESRQRTPRRRGHNSPKRELDEKQRTPRTIKVARTGHPTGQATAASLSPATVIVEVGQSTTMASATNRDAAANRLQDVHSSRPSPPATQPALSVMPQNITDKLRAAASSNKAALDRKNAEQDKFRAARTLMHLTDTAFATPRLPAPPAVQRDVTQPETSLDPREEGSISSQNYRDGADGDVDVILVANDATTRSETEHPSANQGKLNRLTEASTESTTTSQSQHSNGILVPNTQSSGGVSSSAPFLPMDTQVLQTEHSQGNTSADSNSLEYLSMEATMRLRQVIIQAKAIEEQGLAGSVASGANIDDALGSSSQAQEDAAMTLLKTKQVPATTSQPDHFKAMPTKPNASLAEAPNLTSPPELIDIHAPALAGSPNLQPVEPRSFDELLREADDQVGITTSFDELVSD